MDGSGKTTQAELLMNKLRENNVSVRYEHLFSQNIEKKSNLRSRILDRFEQWTCETSRSHPERYLKGTMRAIGIVVFSWISYLDETISRSKYDVFISDRYYYDSLVLFSKNINFEGLLIFSILIPQPDILFFFKVAPATSLKRKGEGLMADIVIASRLYDHMSHYLRTCEYNTDEMNTIDMHETIYKRYLDAIIK